MTKFGIVCTPIVPVQCPHSHGEIHIHELLDVYFRFFYACFIWLECSSRGGQEVRTRWTVDQNAQSWQGVLEQVSVPSHVQHPLRFVPVVLLRKTLFRMVRWYRQAWSLRSLLSPIMRHIDPEILRNSMASGSSRWKIYVTCHCGRPSRQEVHWSST